MLGLFISGLLQSIIAVFHIRNVASLRIAAAMGTAFLFAVVWGFIIVEIVKDVSGPWSIIAYACGLSVGTGLAMYFGEKFITSLSFRNNTKEVAHGTGTKKEESGRNGKDRDEGQGYSD